MPIYEFRCSAGHVQESFERMAERKDCMACEICGGRARRVVSLPVVHGFTAHYDEFAGMYFTSHEDKRRKLALKGFAEKGDTGLRDKRGRIYSVPGAGRRGANAVPYLN